MAGGGSRAPKLPISNEQAHVHGMHYRCISLCNKLVPFSVRCYSRVV